jgi:hypothetical protein
MFNVSGTQDLYSSSYSSDIDDFDFYSVSSSSPRVDQWVSFTIKALDRRGSVISNYD